MLEYKNFISEAKKATVLSKEKKEKYIQRLKQLVDIAIPLLIQLDELYSNLKKYKRANNAIRKLDNFFLKFKTVETKGIPLVIGNKYKYYPPYFNTYFIYIGSICTLLKIVNKIPPYQCCDYRKPEECSCLIEIDTLLLGKYRFYTKPESLAKI
jgi:hypothetical protein